MKYQFIRRCRMVFTGEGGKSLHECQYINVNNIPELNGTTLIPLRQHKQARIQVYSSDINTDVYGSDPNRASLHLKAIDASNNVCVNCIVSPVGSDKWLLKVYLTLNH